MNIINNTIVYPTHTVVCDPAICKSIPGYMEEMQECLAEASEPTMREHARVLRYHNNDGTWGIKAHKSLQPVL
jgi:hypothetical protein